MEVVSNTAEPFEGDLVGGFIDCPVQMQSVSSSGSPRESVCAPTMVMWLLPEKLKAATESEGEQQRHQFGNGGAADIPEVAVAYHRAARY